MKERLLYRSLKNLGTFSTSYMEDSARDIFEAYLPLNGVDINAYPELEEFLSVCENFLLHLCQTQHTKNFRVLSTSGSSEAILLGLYFLKQRFLQKNHVFSTPNIIISPHAHLTWRKAAEYLGLHIKLLPTKLESFVADLDSLENLLDKNTLGVCCSLGSPITLGFDDIAAVNHILNNYYIKKNIFIPIHVDAASGGFVAPFVYPELNWGFKLDHVYSINISSHKYGLVYPSLGWLLLRKKICADKLAYSFDYLGKIISTYTIRFSHPAANLATQHHLWQIKNYQGYKMIMQQLFSLTEILRKVLSQFGLEILSTGHLSHLPGLIFTLKHPTISLQQLINQLKRQQWILPIYRIPMDQHLIYVARIVLRYGMTAQTISTLETDLKNILLEK